MAAFTKLEDSPMFRKQMFSLEQLADELKRRCQQLHKGCQNFISMMKNHIIQQADDEPTDNFHMAKTLMLPSRSNNRRMFECKTCNRQFPSFQALGGHRASHKKSRHTESEEIQVPPEPTKPRVHECAICGLEFSLGQALGGHMRRHRANEEGGNVVSKRVMSGLDLDLNLAPPEEDADCHEGIDLELHLDLALAEKVRFVEWLH